MRRLLLGPLAPVVLGLLAVPALAQDSHPDLTGFWGPDFNADTTIRMPDMIAAPKADDDVGTVGELVAIVERALAVLRNAREEQGTRLVELLARSSDVVSATAGPDAGRGLSVVHGERMPQAHLRGKHDAPSRRRGSAHGRSDGLGCSEPPAAGPRASASGCSRSGP